MFYNKFLFRQNGFRNTYTDFIIVVCIKSDRIRLYRIYFVLTLHKIYVEYVTSCSKDLYVIDISSSLCPGKLVGSYNFHSRSLDVVYNLESLSILPLFSGLKYLQLSMLIFRLFSAFLLLFPEFWLCKLLGFRYCFLIPSFGQWQQFNHKYRAGHNHLLLIGILILIVNIN